MPPQKKVGTGRAGRIQVRRIMDADTEMLPRLTDKA